MRLDPSNYTKDPDGTKDYRADLSDWLSDGDTLLADPSGHEVIVDPADGVTVDSSTNDDTSVTVWLSGGTAGTDVEVTVRATTTQGRIDDGTWTFYIRQQ